MIEYASQKNRQRICFKSGQTHGSFEVRRRYPITLYLVLFLYPEVAGGSSVSPLILTGIYICFDRDFVMVLHSLTSLCMHIPDIMMHAFS